MGWGIVRGEREREGGLKRRKKVVENRDGIFLLGFSLFFVSGVDVRTGKGGREEAQTGRAVLSFFSFIGLATYLTLPYLAFEEETPNMYTVGQ